MTSSVVTGDGISQKTWAARHVANPRLVARIKTDRITQPITDTADATGRNRSWICNAPLVFPWGPLFVLSKGEFGILG